MQQLCPNHRAPFLSLYWKWTPKKKHKLIKQKDANGEIARELHGSELPGAASKAAADAQLAWLNATLAASTWILSATPVHPSHRDLVAV